MGRRCTNRVRTIRTGGWQHENSRICIGTLDGFLERGIGGNAECRASQEAAQVEETEQAQEAGEFHVRRDCSGPILNILIGPLDVG